MAFRSTSLTVIHCCCIYMIDVPAVVGKQLHNHRVISPAVKLCWIGPFLLFQASAVIVVGHSLYFRRLVANYASPAARDLSSSWQLLSDFKLENCGVAMAQLDLAEITGNADTQRREAIQEVKLAFGSAVKR